MKLVKVIKREELIEYLDYKRTNSTFTQGLDYQNGYLDALENLKFDIEGGLVTSYLFKGEEEGGIIL